MSFIDQNNNFSFLVVKGCLLPTYKVLGITFIFDLKKVIGIYYTNTHASFRWRIKNGKQVMLGT